MYWVEGFVAKVSSDTRFLPKDMQPVTRDDATVWMWPAREKGVNTAETIRTGSGMPLGNRYEIYRLVQRSSLSTRTSRYNCVALAGR